MSRTWIIAAVESNPPELFDRVWKFDVENHVISIGWRQLEDVSNLDRNGLAERVAETYPQKPLSTQSLYANMLWAFYNEIVVGDRIFARRGRKCLMAVGRVTGPARYAPDFNPHCDHQNFLPVEWEPFPSKVYDSIVFPMHTLTEMPQDVADRLLVGDALLEPLPDATSPIEDRQSFLLEKYLEEFIVDNFASVFKGAMRVFTDEDGNLGQQYSTETGPIDILAIDNDNNFVVIELKKGRTSDQVVGQVLRYMGWVKQNLCNPTQSVSGLVICNDSDKKIKYAISMVPGVSMRYYSISFELRESV